MVSKGLHVYIRPHKTNLAPWSFVFSYTHGETYIHINKRLKRLVSLDSIESNGGIPRGHENNTFNMYVYVLEFLYPTMLKENPFVSFIFLSRRGGIDKSDRSAPAILLIDFMFFLFQSRYSSDLMKTKKRKSSSSLSPSRWTVFSFVCDECPRSEKNKPWKITHRFSDRNITSQKMFSYFFHSPKKLRIYCRKNAAHVSSNLNKN